MNFMLAIDSFIDAETEGWLKTACVYVLGNRFHKHILHLRESMM